jgi:predicted TIM-barrel fold metal-dependent hydrolase
MTYAQGRTFYDADSHIMELPDFLAQYADPALRDELPAIKVPRLGQLANLVDAAARDRRHAPDHVAELVALGDRLISGPKGYMALGAFNRDERTRALDLLGFSRQLVFATFSEGIAFGERYSIEQRYGAARAHNRAMAEFCAADPRLMGVALLPLDEPHIAVAELDRILALGLKAVWVPHRPCGGRSPGHDDLDPFWARLAEARVPFVLHVGGVPLQIEPAWMNTGRPIPTDWLGTGENVRGKDMTSLHQPAETFVGALVLDGVFERHPQLRGGVIELGAGWVPSMIQRLDWIAEIWRKSDPALAALTRRPSEQIIEHMAFTPYVYEDVGALMRQSDDRLYLFSSDYPHAEGGRQPLERFMTSLASTPAPSQQRFYSDNFADLFALSA